MKKIALTVVLLLASLIFISGCGQAQKEETAKFTNPVLAGFYPDPSVCKVGDDFYLVNSSFSYFPGLPIFHSKDLVHWQQIGSVLEREEQLDLEGQGVSRGLFAPAITHHDGVFYVICTMVDKGGNFIVTSKDPAGDWSNPVWVPELNGIDPSLFFDDDGSAYIVYNSIPPDDKALYEGHRTIRMYEFDVENMKVKGENTILVNGGVDISKKPVWIEGPHLYKINGNYYLMAAEGGTAEDHSEVVFRSSSVNGPFEPYDKNPILTQRDLDPARKDPITCTGHADLVEAKPGEWWAVFLGCRPYPPTQENYFNTGRETFLAPVEWKDGWPVINPDFKEVQYSYSMPVDTEYDKNIIPQSGNFTYRYTFEEKSLDPAWLFLRTPHEKWYSLIEDPGELSIKVRPETCSGLSNPSFIGHRQQHLTGSATVSLSFNAASENEKAGLVIFQNETHYYYIAKSVKNGKPVVELFKSNDSGMDELASAELPAPNGDDNLLLMINFDGGSYSFSYGFAKDDKDLSSVKWGMLKDKVDGTFLSTKIAGGFVGSIFGMYATSMGQKSDNIAEYDWFEYKGDDAVYK